MSEARLHLFDDRCARRWAPFSLTRPMGEMLFGALTMRERAKALFGVECEGHVSRRRLVGYDEIDAARAIRLEDVGVRGPRILLSSRAVPDFQTVELPSGPALIRVGGEAAGWSLPDGAPLPSELWVRDPAATTGAYEPVDLPGRVLPRPWHLVDETPGRIEADIAVLWPEDDETPGAIRIGGHNVSLGKGAEVEPGVHLDLRKGPIRLSDGVRVEGPARLIGPLFVGPGSTILGGTVGTSSIGPVCLVRGEVACSVFLGYDNKAHDGHIGHALVGRWVNLGAFTTNSDLKNNYKNVQVWTPEKVVDTKLMKVGSFLGDHVKTGIGTVLNTGTVVGAGSNLFGGLMPPTYVPAFSWGAGDELGDYALDKFFETAKAVMARRNRELQPGERAILEEAWNATAGKRGANEGSPRVS